MPSGTTRRRNHQMRTFHLHAGTYKLVFVTLDCFGKMTGISSEYVSVPAPNHDLVVLGQYFKAVNNKRGVRQDLEILCKFVRDILFYAMIHDIRASENPDKDIMGEKGKACTIFVQLFLEDKGKLSNSELFGCTDQEREHYLRFLWREGLTTKSQYNSRRALSNEKSAVYAGISEAFKSKWWQERIFSPEMYSEMLIKEIRLMFLHVLQN